MKGDFTRSTFDPSKHYSSVRMQQGRVQVDADWNEAMDLTRRRAEVEAVDVIGPCGAPVHDAAFRIVTDLSTLTAEEKRRLPAVPLPPLKSGDFYLTGGRYYADGILCENDFVVPFSLQPDLPSTPLQTAGTYVAYLDVWDRHITALEDPEIRESALGGPDHGTRSRTVWQVKTVLLKARPKNTLVNCPAQFSEYDDAIASPTGKMRARTKPADDQTSPCTLPPGAGYRSLENQLYRVEVHHGGVLNSAAFDASKAATFKWSRDNGSIVAKIESISGTEITLVAPGRDSVRGFATGNWIEVTDDQHELRGVEGSLARIVDVSDRVITIDTASVIGPAITNAEYKLDANAKARRWDSEGAVTVKLNTDSNGVLVDDGYISLENGIQVKFEDGTYRSGDYWLIPARTDPNGIEWPAESPTNGVAELPGGIRHHYCRIALLTLAAGALTVEDCRPLFPPLVERGIHVTGVFGTRGSGQVLPLQNDAPIRLNNLLHGLTITLDRAPLPETVSRPTCFVSVEAPIVVSLSRGVVTTNLPPLQRSLEAFVPLILNGTVVTSGANIVWTPDPSIVNLLSNYFATAVGDRRILAHLTLKGNSIWTGDDPPLYLDGEAFGRRSRGQTTTSIGYPSGDGRRGGDFEMWFWLTEYCDEQFPAGFVPFAGGRLLEEDPNGDRVFVGSMTGANFASVKALPLPELTNEVYCSIVQMAPGVFVIAYVPSAAERNGDFSGWGGKLIDPATGGQFPNNIIPTNRLPAAGAAFGVFAWRIRSLPPVYYYYGYGGFQGIGTELL